MTALATTDAAVDRGRPSIVRSRPRLFAAYVLAALLALVPSVSAQTARQAGFGHYIEFLARPGTTVFGHSFVEIGTLTSDGKPRAYVTLGLYPAADPRTDTAALFAAHGRIMQTPADRRERATTRFRVDVSVATYRNAIAHAERLRQAWRRYDLATENCNAVVFEFADRLGLEVPHDMLELPAPSCASWRRATAAGRARHGGNRRSVSRLAASSRPRR